MKKIIIAIDGYSSCGKSTLAKALAAKLHYAYLDTGAMYRAATLFFLRHHTDLIHHEDLTPILEKMDIHFEVNPANGESEVFLDGKDVEQEIRSMEVSERVSEIAAIREVRQHLVRLQQKIGHRKGIVLDGRDIGTAVFPNAELKIFMTADPEVRVLRRYEELQRKEVAASINDVRKNINERDYMDTHRAESPLVKAEDAFVLDNSGLNHEQQLSLALEMVKRIEAGL